MDSVRFGRALGIGARSAAKALVMAADAAAAPKATGSPAVQTPSRAAGSGARLGETAARTTAQVRATHAGLSRGGKRFGQAVWGPFVRLSGVLWLEMTGVFFGLFLVTALLSAWKLRGSLHDTGLNHAEHQHLLLSIGMAGLFGYFCVSSFVRAARRERGKR